MAISQQHLAGGNIGNSKTRQNVIKVPGAFAVPKNKNVNPAGDGEARSLQRDETLARHLFQIGKCRIDRTGAKLTGVLGNAVEPAIDEKYRALPWLAITAVRFRRGVPQATDIAHVPADGAL